MAVLLLLAACSGTGEGGFFGSSGRYDQPTWGDTATDTGSDTGGDTGSSTGDPGAPVLSNLEVTWEDYPNIGIVLQVIAEFTDEGDDFSGGVCYVDVFNPDYISSFEMTASEESGSNVCLVSGTTLTMGFQDLDDSVEGAILLSVKDESNNVSAEVEGSTED